MPVIDKDFNALVCYMGGRVPHTLTTSDYPDYAAMRTDWLNSGRIKVNILHSDNTIFGASFINWYFRAWHDWAHIQANGDFSPLGERKAAEYMKQSMRALCPDILPNQLSRFDDLIDSEVIGQGEYYAQHGDFPTDQFQFTLDYLDRKQVAA